jgi:hypothetical protein
MVVHIYDQIQVPNRYVLQWGSMYIHTICSVFLLCSLNLFLLEDHTLRFKVAVLQRFMFLVSGLKLSFNVFSI